MSAPRGVVIGASAGGISALRQILSSLPESFPLPVAVALHMRQGASVDFNAVLSSPGHLRVSESEEKRFFAHGQVYVAPPGYHLLIEKDLTLSLSVDEPVNWARPSINVLFESAAEALGPGAVGIVLTGANADGALGLSRIAKHGGVAVVQDPASAEVSTMPEAALAAVPTALVLALRDIGSLISSLPECSE